MVNTNIEGLGLFFQILKARALTKSRLNQLERYFRMLAFRVLEFCEFERMQIEGHERPADVIFISQLEIALVIWQAHTQMDSATVWRTNEEYGFWSLGAPGKNPNSPVAQVTFMLANGQHVKNPNLRGKAQLLWFQRGPERQNTL